MTGRLAATMTVGVNVYFIVADDLPALLRISATDNR